MSRKSSCMMSPSVPHVYCQHVVSFNLMSAECNAPDLVCSIVQISSVIMFTLCDFYITQSLQKCIPCIIQKIPVI
ncbi:hypothetical protein E2C01_026524 [Portunus trituberculatus]|uniref:Uncharacterized protein n=1 Tax=Portunus trituberculatus TaxID=210409 RepID=A0A5B7EG53_PORTR|nr:hypothetical protein [Portunus trituberculatus]